MNIYEYYIKSYQKSGKHSIDLVSILLNHTINNPGQIIIAGNDSEYTYKEIVSKSLLVSSQLNQSNIVNRGFLGIYTDQNISMYLGIFGSLCSRLGYIPLSPEYPDARVKYMISDSEIKAIFTQNKYKDKLLSFIDKEIEIITESDLVNDKDIQSFITYSSTNDKDPVYMIYTSGSTGIPKGIIINNKNITNQLQWISEALKFNKSKTILQKTPMSFDASQWEILAILFGSKVIIGDNDLYKNPKKIISYIKKYSVTSLQCVPTLLKALLSCDEFKECESLDEIFCGGEALTKKLAKEFKSIIPGRRLINLYGPTECTINASFLEVDLDHLDDYPDVIPIGKPVRNTEIFVVDKHGHQLAVGSVGEICISGDQLSPGYNNKIDVTKKTFVTNSHVHKNSQTLVYKTGDLGYFDEEGNLNYSSRMDSQVKIRGYRIELDEIKVAIENHDWVNNATVIVGNNNRSSSKELIAYVELNPREAALMDQGLNSSHHISKSNKIQVQAQLSNPGIRDSKHTFDTLLLPGKFESKDQSAKAFARKTYRSFKGNYLDRDKLLQLLNTKITSINQKRLDFYLLGQIMRMFGQFHSSERLLPKYSYASPGALYGVQIYVEVYNFQYIESGIYYYNPVDHSLNLVCSKTTEHSGAQIHLVGIDSAISCVYTNNVLEVLEIEAGHIIGMFDDVLHEHGLYVRDIEKRLTPPEYIVPNDNDHYLCSFYIKDEIALYPDNPVSIYVQNNNSNVIGLSDGMHKYSNGEFSHFSNKSILKKEVIAINQSVYKASHFGVAFVIDKNIDWKSYIYLGRELQRLQINDLNIGLMSSGYSSKTGHDLPSSIKMNSILKEHGIDMKAFYFAIGGPISEDQKLSQGMNEDLIHLRGPTEILRDELSQMLPVHMIPNKIVILPEIPKTSNGKIDNNLLLTQFTTHDQTNNTPKYRPTTQLQKQLCRIWSSVLKYNDVYIDDDFFEHGGDSLSGVILVSEINETFDSVLPLQCIFDGCSIRQLEEKLSHVIVKNSRRTILLNNANNKASIFCWPGLGGYPMGLKNIANRIKKYRKFYGIQSYGINANEIPYATIEEMARVDIKEIKQIQKEGPYSLWGYSFGARVAFETAYQLESEGHIVEDLILIAPGSPKINIIYDNSIQGKSSYSNPEFVSILYSVFFRKITGAELELCLKCSHNHESFVRFVNSKLPEFNVQVIERIISIVEKTFDFKYTFSELEKRKIKAQICIIKARDDDYSFLDGCNSYYTIQPKFYQIHSGHYETLSDYGAQEIVDLVEHIYGFQGTHETKKLDAF
jgi:amino acid adenylation domain-containing protein